MEWGEHTYESADCLTEIKGVDDWNTLDLIKRWLSSDVYYLELMGLWWLELSCLTRMRKLETGYLCSFSKNMSPWQGRKLVWLTAQKTIATFFSTALNSVFFDSFQRFSNSAAFTPMTEITNWYFSTMIKLNIERQLLTILTLAWLEKHTVWNKTTYLKRTITGNHDGYNCESGLVGMSDSPFNSKWEDLRKGLNSCEFYDVFVCVWLCMCVTMMCDYVCKESGFE